MTSNSKTIAEPLAMGIASRRGLFNSAVYIDDEAEAFFTPVMGASIEFGDMKGVVDVFRTEVVHYSARPYQAWMLKWVLPAIEQLKVKLNEFAKVPAGEDNALDFDSLWDLSKWLNDDLWKKVTRAIYGSFPKDSVDYSERFYAGAFSAQAINWSFYVNGRDFEVYITAPEDDLGGLTQIRVNKGIFQAMAHAFGVKNKFMGPYWEYLESFLNKDSKTLSTDNIIEYLVSKGSCPCGINGNIKLDHYVAMKAILAKIFSICHQRISLKDWKIPLNYAVFMRNVSDEQVSEHFAEVYNNWTQTQFTVPTGDIEAIAELRVLPICDPVLKEVEWDAGFNTAIPNNENEAMRRPTLKFLEISPVTMRKYVIDETEDYQGKKHTKTRDAADTKIVTPDLIWVTIWLLNYAESEQMISYNKTFGSYAAADVTKECAALIAAVYPNEFLTYKQSIPGQRLEKRHWKVHFQTIGALNPPASLDAIVHSLFNIKSIYGPKYYAVDYESLFYDSELILLDIYDGDKFDEKMKIYHETVKADIILTLDKIDELAKRLGLASEKDDFDEEPDNNDVPDEEEPTAPVSPGILDWVKAKLGLKEEEEEEEVPIADEPEPTEDTEEPKV